MDVNPADQVAAVILARAVADALNPDRPANTALLGHALLHPLMLQVVALLDDAGYRIERTTTPADAA